jgi:hypothetical protein
VDKAAFANRKWDRAMLRFLRLKRRQGKPIRWIAEKLGVSLVRAVAEAINRGLTMHTAYRGRRCLSPREPDLPPLGELRELPGENQCRWMAGHPTGAWRMCARPTEPGSPWCPHHRAQVYVKRRRINSIVMAGPDPATQGHSPTADTFRVFAASRESLLQAPKESHAKPRSREKTPSLEPWVGGLKPGHDEQLRANKGANE